MLRWNRLLLLPSNAVWKVPAVIPTAAIEQKLGFQRQKGNSARIQEEGG